MVSGTSNAGDCRDACKFGEVKKFYPLKQSFSNRVGPDTYLDIYWIMDIKQIYNTRYLDIQVEKKVFFIKWCFII